jgi:hypothetical protein
MARTVAALSEWVRFADEWENASRYTDRDEPGFSTEAGAPLKRSNRSALLWQALFYRWKEMENHAGPRSGGRRSTAPASFGGCDVFLARRERTNRDVISVRISERELLRSGVRIEVWFLFEPTDERACPLKRQVEIIDTEE